MRRYNGTTNELDWQQYLDPEARRLAGLNDSPLDRPFRFARFRSQGAQIKVDKRASLRDVASKAQLPWTKLAVFGDKRTPLRQKLVGSGMTGNSLRHDANVLAVTGVEADYDGEEIMPEDARDMLAEAAIAALADTTPSHSPDARRWRVFARFGEEITPSERYQRMARRNGVFGDVLDVSYGYVRHFASESDVNITAENLRLLAYDLAHARGELK